MGTDKATLVVQGIPLGAVAVHALVDAGVTEVVLIGGSTEQAVICGAPAVADLHPGSGPRGGVISALDWAAGRTLVALACDLPGITGGDVLALLDAAAQHGSADVIMATRDGRRCPPTGVWRASAANQLVVAPGRSFSEAWSSLGVVDLELGDAVVDLDTPFEVAQLTPVAKPRRPPR